MTAGRPPASVTALLVVSAAMTVTCLFAPAGIPALALAVAAMLAHRQDPVRATRLTRVGWATAGLLGLGTVVAALVWFFTSPAWFT